MLLKAGVRLGPYEIKALLGAGGMGEVYRGRDTRLGRDVALKVIAPQRVADPAARRRFELEARAASALNHPAIVTVYDVGETDGVSWIAMEWVEGRTLRQELDGSALPLRVALSIARQVADGLAAAHAKGIVHRDLKPANVMLAEDGRAKILDFGLARQTQGEALQGEASRLETLAAPQDATREGTILGTVGYMSPEQAAGRAADFRSDQFSFGLVVYEMLAGRRAFSRPTPVETLSAIIRDEPVPLRELRQDVPQPVERAIATCLAKRPQDRFASTRDLAAALDALATGACEAVDERIATSIDAPEGAVRAATRPWLRRRTALGLAGVLLLLVTAGILSQRASRSAIDSVAVLPFASTGQDAGAEDLGNGVSESLIDQLSRVPSLRVMARATVSRFKGADDPLEVGRRLRVGAVVTGTVSRRDANLSVSAELVETATGVRLWGERYDRPFVDLLSVQDSIAAEIAGRLRLRLSGEERRDLVRHGTENLEAHELYLKARRLLEYGTEEDDLEARRLFHQAVERDPGYLEARLGLASTYARGAGSGFARPAEAWPRAEEELRKVLERDPGNVLARAGLAGRRFLFDWDWAGVEGEFRELSTDPRLVLGTQFHPVATYFTARGWSEEAVDLIERALRVDPENLETRIMLADRLQQAGRLQDSIALYRAFAEAEPTDPRPRFGLAQALRRLGDIPGALGSLRAAYELSQEVAGIRALEGAKTEQDYQEAEAVVSRATLESLEALARQRYVSPLDFAQLHARLGEKEKAFARLEEAVAERSVGLVLLRVDRAWDRIRDDPRFAALVRRVGIP
jgi:eukaryotic-like serine/threonine-protein kinase